MTDFLYAAGIVTAIAGLIGLGLAIGFKWQERRMDLLRASLDDCEGRLAKESVAALGATTRDLQTFYMERAEREITLTKDDAQREIEKREIRILELEQAVTTTLEGARRRDEEIAEERAERERLLNEVAGLQVLHVQLASFLDAATRIEQESRRREEQEGVEPVMVFLVTGQPVGDPSEIERRARERMGNNFVGTVWGSSPLPHSEEGAVVRTRGRDWRRYFDRYLKAEGWRVVPIANVRDNSSGGISSWAQEYHTYFCGNAEVGPSVRIRTMSNGSCVMLDFAKGEGWIVRLVAVVSVNDLTVVPATAVFRGDPEEVDTASIHWIDKNALLNLGVPLR